MTDRRFDAGETQWRPKRKRLRFLAYTAFASLVLLELVLQAAALVVWWSREPPPPAGAVPGEAVLCIGDSYTYGYGVDKEQSYPAHLQRLLADRGTGGPRRVVNAGWPGRDSRDVLERIDALLREHRPGQTYILVGINDIWNMPEPLDLRAGGRSGAGDRFQWRLRSWRLCKWFAGRVAKHLGPKPPPRRLDEMAARRKRHYGRASNALAAREKRAARAARERGDAAAMARHYAAALAADGEDPHTHFEIVESNKLAGRPQASAASLDWLRRRVRERPDPYVALVLVRALLAHGASTQARAAAEAAVAQRPDDAFLRAMAAWEAFQAGDTEHALQEIDRSVQTRSTVQGHDYRARMYATGPKDPLEGLRSVFAAHLAEPDAKRTVRWIKYYRHVYTRQAGRAAIADLTRDSSKRKELEGLLERGLDKSSEKVAATLRSHLEQLVARCRSGGSAVALVGYPFPTDPLDDILAELGRTGVDVIEPRRRFAELLETRARTDLFVADGHCNGPGNAEVARLVAAHLLRSK